MDTAKCKLWVETLFYFIALTVGYTTLAAASNDERFTRMHYGLAQGTYHIGDYAGTLESLSIFLQRHPEHLAALQLKAQTLWQLGRPQEAEQTLQQAARIQPDNETTLALQSALLQQVERQALLKKVRRLAKEQSFEQVLLVLEKYPDWLCADPQLAELYLNVSLRQENWSALEHFLHSLPEHFLEADYRAYLLGRIGLASGDLPAARAHFAVAQKLNPIPSLLNSILFYQACCTLQDPQMEANGAAKIVQALDAGYRPETLPEFLIASTSLLHQNEPERALRLLESALHRRVVDNAAFWLLLSRVQLENQQPARAISAATQAISLQENCTQAYILRARAHTLRKDFAQAKIDYRQALTIQPSRLDLYYALAINCLYLSEIEAAYSALQRASQIEQTSDFWLIFAVLAQANGRPDEAQSALAHYKNLQVQDRSTSADYLSSILHQSDDHASRPLTVTGPEHHDFQQFHRGQSSAAELLDRRRNSQSENKLHTQQNCALFYWMAQSYQTRGQYSKSLHYFQKALKIGTPDWIEWHLANWQLQLNQHNGAR
jgi:tetratricopeptide (TPR) repeat protein